MQEISREVDHETKEVIITRADKCVWDYITPQTRAYYHLFRLYQDGQLLESGGVNDQPAWYINVMLQIENMYNRHKNDALDRARNK